GIQLAASPTAEVRDAPNPGKVERTGFCVDARDSGIHVLVSWCAEAAGTFSRPDGSDAPARITSGGWHHRIYVRHSDCHWLVRLACCASGLRRAGRRLLHTPFSSRFL